MCSEFDTPFQRFVVFARDGHSNRFTDTDTLKLTAKAPEDDLDISEGGLCLKFDTLPETNIFAPENGWLEEMLVSGRVNNPRDEEMSLIWTIWDFADQRLGFQLESNLA